MTTNKNTEQSTMGLESTTTRYNFSQGTVVARKSCFDRRSNRQCGRRDGHSIAAGGIFSVFVFLCHLLLLSK